MKKKWFNRSELKMYTNNIVRRHICFQSELHKTVYDEVLSLLDNHCNRKGNYDYIMGYLDCLMDKLWNENVYFAYKFNSKIVSSKDLTSEQLRIANTAPHAMLWKKTNKNYTEWNTYSTKK